MALILRRGSSVSCRALENGMTCRERTGQCKETRDATESSDVTWAALARTRACQRRYPHSAQRCHPHAMDVGDGDLRQPVPHKNIISKTKRRDKAVNTSGDQYPLTTNSRDFTHSSRPNLIVEGMADDELAAIRAARLKELQQQHQQQKQTAQVALFITDLVGC